MNNDLDVLQEKLTALYNFLDAGAEGGVGDNAERNYSYGDNLSETPKPSASGKSPVPKGVFTTNGVRRTVHTQYG